MKKISNLCKKIFTKEQSLGDQIVNNLKSFFTTVYLEYSSKLKTPITEKEFKEVYWKSLAIVLSNHTEGQPSPYIVMDIDGMYSLFIQINNDKKIPTLTFNILNKDQVKYMLHKE